MMSFSPSGHVFGTPSGRQGSRTLISTGENRLSGAARQPGIRLPSIITHQWTDRELNPDLQFAELASSHWTISPLHRVDRTGVEPATPTLQGSVASWEHASPFFSIGPFGNRTRSPSLPRRCAAGTPTDHFTSVIPAGIEPALSWLSPRRLRRWTTGSCSC